MMSIVDRVRNISQNINTKEIQIPNALKLELSAVCNHKCKYCVVPTIKPKTKFMSEKVFYKAIDDALDLGIKEIGIFHMGEGTLHPKFYNLIEEIPDCFDIFITTNGTQYDKLEYLVELGIKSIKFSLNGYNREIHNQVTGVDTFDLIINNIKKLVKHRNSILSPTRISASSIYYNNLEQEDFVKEISKYVDNFYFTEVFNHANKVKNKYIELSEDTRIITNLCQLPCYGLYNLCHVKPNGDINLCKWGVDDEFVIGNILESSLKDLWFGEKANRLRELSTTGKFETCNRCVGFKNDC